MFNKKIDFIFLKLFRLNKKSNPENIMSFNTLDLAKELFSEESSTLKFYLPRDTPSDCSIV